MSVNRRPPTTREIDLDATDQLPVIQLTPELAESLGETDTIAGPVVPAGVSDLAETLRELESRLQRRDERIAQLELALQDARGREAELRSQADQERSAALEHTAEVNQHLADADHEVLTLRDEMDRREARLLAAQVEIDGQRRALAHSRAELEQRHAAFRHQAMDLAELRSRCERQLEALQSAAGWRAVSEAQILALETAVARLNGTATVAVAVPAIATVSTPAAMNGAAAVSPAPAVAPVPAVPPAPVVEVAAAAAPSEPDPGLSTAEMAAARVAIAVYDEQQAQILRLQAELEQLRERNAEMEAQLREARDRAEALVSEIHSSAALLGSTQDIRARPDPGDSGTRPGLQVLSIELPQRLLIRQEGGTGISYPLGRRTTIGRTPDNDIQIDTTYVSRHHAVLLASAQECILEDLNSTNGVLVNGRKAGRQVLRDGDTITIGNTVFTFLQTE